LISRLLANLWDRNAILQCCHNQYSVDFLGAAYLGSVSPDAIFDPALLFPIVGQIKFKSRGDAKAEQELRPVGITRDLSDPLPYLALLMELGAESTYQETRSKVKSTAAEPAPDGTFQQLTDDWLAAVKRLKQHRGRKGCKRSRTEELKREVETRRLAMDSCNRYSICVRGSSSEVYGILKQADIARQFATLLRIAMPSPTNNDSAIQHMRPLERLGVTSHTDWMRDFVVTNEEDRDAGDVE
jgi:hypothetical protein